MKKLYVSLAVAVYADVHNNNVGYGSEDYLDVFYREDSDTPPSQLALRATQQHRSRLQNDDTVVQKFIIDSCLNLTAMHDLHSDRSTILLGSISRPNKICTCVQCYECGPSDGGVGWLVHVLFAVAITVRDDVFNVLKKQLITECFPR